MILEFACHLYNFKATFITILGPLSQATFYQQIFGALSPKFNYLNLANKRGPVFNKVHVTGNLVDTETKMSGI